MSCPIKLETLAGEEPVEILQVDTGSLTMGREIENSIVIDSDSVSRVHSSLFEVQGCWLIRDLQSTNGTQVNGVKVLPGQVRLLRSGDLIQIANFSIRLTELESEETEGQPPTLLIFNGDHFETEFPLATPGSQFVAGGPDGHIFLDGTDSPQMQISVNGPRLELSTANGTQQVVVNGMAVGGVTALSDRDEIDVNGVKIIVNDRASAGSAKENQMIAALEARSKTAGTAIQAHVGKPEQRAWDWDSESSRRKMVGGRKFVFGSDPEQDETTGTVAMSRQEMAFRVGEVSGAQRFSQTAQRLETVNDPDATEKRQMIVGAVMLVLIVIAIIYFVTAG